MTFGKLRLAYGEVGVEPPPYNTQSIYVSPNYSDSYGGSLSTDLFGAGSFTPSQDLGDPNLSPEIKKEYEERGLTVIKEAEMNDIKAMNNNMIEEGRMYLDAEGKVAEASFYWYEGDVLCKCRPDVICPPVQKPYSANEVVVVDYKTTQSCHPKEFAGSVRKYGYDMQAAWYKRGMEKAGFKVKEFVLISFAEEILVSPTLPNKTLPSLQ